MVESSILKVAGNREQAESRIVAPLIRFALGLGFFLPWLLPNIINWEEGALSFPDPNGDQAFYLLRARSEWDGIGFVEKVSAGSDATFGFQSYFEFVFFRIPGALMSDLVSFRTYLLLIIVITIFATVFVIDQFCKSTSSSTVEQITKLVSVCLSLELLSIVQYGEMVNNLLLMSRWPFPALHYILIFWALKILFFKQGTVSWQALYPIAISVFVYPYTFQFLFCLYLVKFLSLLSGQSKYKEGQKKLLLILFSVVVLAAFNFYDLVFHKASEKNGNSFNFIMELEFTREFYFPKIILATLLISLVIRQLGEITKFQIAWQTSLATLLAYNSNVFLGFRVQPSHLLWYVMTPIFAWSLISIFFSLTRSRNDLRVTKCFRYILALGSLVTLFLLVKEATIKSNQTFYSNKDYQLIRKWDTDDSLVFYSINHDLSNKILINTKHRAFWNPVGLSNRGGEVRLREYVKATIALEIPSLEDKVEKWRHLESFCRTNRVEPCLSIQFLVGVSSGKTIRDFDFSLNPFETEFVKGVWEEIPEFSPSDESEMKTELLKNLKLVELK